MKQLHTDFKKDNGKKSQKSKVHQTVVVSEDGLKHKQDLREDEYLFKCNECNKLVFEEVMKDFMGTLPDQTLTCPFCLSLDLEIMEVAK